MKHKNHDIIFYIRNNTPFGGGNTAIIIPIHSAGSSSSSSSSSSLVEYYSNDSNHPSPSFLPKPPEITYAIEYVVRPTWGENNTLELRSNRLEYFNPKLWANTHTLCVGRRLLFCYISYLITEICEYNKKTKVFKPYGHSTWPPINDLINPTPYAYKK